MSRIGVLTAGFALAIASPVAASDFSGLGPIVGAGFAVLALIVALIGLGLRKLPDMKLRNLIRTVLVSALFAPVIDAGTGPFGEYANIWPMAAVWVLGDLHGNWPGHVFPPLVFSIVVFVIAMGMSRSRAAKLAD